MVMFKNVPSVLENNLSFAVILCNTIEQLLEWFMSNEGEKQSSSDAYMVHHEVTQSPETTSMPPGLPQGFLQPRTLPIPCKRAAPRCSLGLSFMPPLRREAFSGVVFLSQHSVLFLHNTHLNLTWCILFSFLSVSV